MFRVSGGETPLEPLDAKADTIGVVHLKPKQLFFLLEKEGYDLAHGRRRDVASKEMGGAVSHLEPNPEDVLILLVHNSFDLQDFTAFDMAELIRLLGPCLVDVPIYSDELDVKQTNTWLNETDGRGSPGNAAL